MRAKQRGAVKYGAEFLKLVRVGIAGVSVFKEAVDGPRLLEAADGFTGGVPVSACVPRKVEAEGADGVLIRAVAHLHDAPVAVRERLPLPAQLLLRHLLRRDIDDDDVEPTPPVTVHNEVADVVDPFEFPVSRLYPVFAFVEVGAFYLLVYLRKDPFAVLMPDHRREPVVKFADKFITRVAEHLEHVFADEGKLLVLLRRIAENASGRGLYDRVELQRLLPQRQFRTLLFRYVHYDAVHDGVAVFAFFKFAADPYVPRIPSAGYDPHDEGGLASARRDHAAHSLMRQFTVARMYEAPAFIVQKRRHAFARVAVDRVIAVIAVKQREVVVNIDGEDAAVGHRAV